MDSSEFDCIRCGACCRGRDGTILVSPESIVRFRAAGRAELEGSLQEGHFSEQAFPMTEQGQCAHLRVGDGLHLCSIYEIRADSCRSLEPGTRQCLEARRYGTLR